MADPASETKIADMVEENCPAVQSRGPQIENDHMRAQRSLTQSIHKRDAKVVGGSRNTTSQPETPAKQSYGGNDLSEVKSRLIEESVNLSTSEVLPQKKSYNEMQREQPETKKKYIIKKKDYAEEWYLNNKRCRTKSAVSEEETPKATPLITPGPSPVEEETVNFLFGESHKRERRLKGVPVVDQSKNSSYLESKDSNANKESRRPQERSASRGERHRTSKPSSRSYRD